MGAGRALIIAVVWPAAWVNAQGMADDLALARRLVEVARSTAAMGHSVVRAQAPLVTQRGPAEEALRMNSVQHC